ncbi:hypothetical protein LTR50_000127 [Elasticomyces elasticus]|nr:hypothetical protein LTR50_000127 [Elasticomyces elasticus]
MATGTLHSVYTNSLSSLPSPTLTNPEMVLPDDFPLPMPSSPPRSWHPPSPSYLRDQATTAVTPAKRDKRGLMSRKLMLLRSRTGSGLAQSIENSGSTRGGAGYVESALASSPTLRLSSPQTDSTSRVEGGEKRFSTISSSIDSMDLEDMHFAGFHGAESTDEEGFDQEAVQDAERWDAGGHRDPRQRQKESDEESSAALSRRAELILANAKKRLNLMEGNLRGARDLVAPLTAANLKRAASVGSAHYAAGAFARERFGFSSLRYTTDSHLYAHSHATDSSERSPRNSETVISSGAKSRPQTAQARMPPASGALRDRSGSGQDATAQWTASLRGSRSQEVLRSSGRVTPRPLHRSSTENNLEPLPESDAQSGARSAAQSRLCRTPSVTDDLREQLHSLKGRISSLRERAREDILRRQNLHSVKSTSPVSEAGDWYAGARGYDNEALSDDAGVGWSPTPPAIASFPAHDYRNSEDLHGNAFDYEDSSYELQMGGRMSYASQEPMEESKQPVVKYPDSPLSSDRHLDSMPTDIISERDDGVDGDSIYEDAPYSPPQRHEDRPDAFDYENFFLHSAMGNFGTPRRSSSFSSTDSIETAKGITLDTEQPPPTPETPEQLRDIERNIHGRTYSTESASTLASFATAIEAQKEGRRSAQRAPLESRTESPSDRSAPPSKAALPSNPGPDRADSGVGISDRPTSTSGRSTPRLPPPTTTPANTALGHDNATTQQSSWALASSALLDPRSEPLGLRDKALLFTVFESLRNVTMRLQRGGEGEGLGESRAMRRRLDEARRVLDGFAEPAESARAGVV